MRIRCWPILVCLSVLSAGCGSSPVAPSPSPLAKNPAPATAPTLTVTVPAMPLHAGDPAKIHYDVTAVNGLESLELSSSDGALTAKSVVAPAAASSTLLLTFGRPGTFSVSLVATLGAGSTLNATFSVDVVD
jgi:hypothetical protein